MPLSFTASDTLACFAVFNSYGTQTCSPLGRQELEKSTSDQGRTGCRLASLAKWCWWDEDQISMHNYQKKQLGYRFTIVTCFEGEGITEKNGISLSKCIFF